MIDFIKNLVSHYPNLKYKRNQGEDRVRKIGVKGSLWIKRRYEGFCLKTTSEIASILDREIERLHGDPIGEHLGYKYWYIDDLQTVEKIFEFLNLAE